LRTVTNMLTLLSAYSSSSCANLNVINPHLPGRSVLRKNRRQKIPSKYAQMQTLFKR
ncbi:hypothetical protein T05_13992, partial [Trichinella murrelli]